MAASRSMTRRHPGSSLQRILEVLVADEPDAAADHLDRGRVDAGEPAVDAEDVDLHVVERRHVAQPEDALDGARRAGVVDGADQVAFPCTAHGQPSSASLRPPQKSSRSRTPVGAATCRATPSPCGSSPS